MELFPKVVEEPPFQPMLECIDNWEVEKSGKLAFGPGQQGLSILMVAVERCIRHLARALLELVVVTKRLDLESWECVSTL